MEDDGLPTQPVPNGTPGQCAGLVDLHTLSGLSTRAELTSSTVPLTGA
jgi:hypothetical protein